MVSSHLCLLAVVATALVCAAVCFVGQPLRKPFVSLFLVLVFAVFAKWPARDFPRLWCLILLPCYHILSAAAPPLDERTMPVTSRHVTSGNLICLAGDFTQWLWSMAAGLPRFIVIAVTLQVVVQMSNENATDPYPKPVPCTSTCTHTHITSQHQLHAHTHHGTLLQHADVCFYHVSISVVAILPFPAVHGLPLKGRD